MDKDPTEFTDDERQWMPPQPADMVHPFEEVGKGAIVILTAFIICCCAFLREPPNSMLLIGFAK
jgi:hypothetical protein